MGIESAIIGTSLAGAGASLYGAGRQADAANRAADLQAGQYARTRADLEPWREAGANALVALQALYGLGGMPPDYSGFYDSPGYQARLDAGLTALDRSAAARGGLVSGNQLRAAERFGQDLAAAEFGAHTNRLAALAGLGQTAAAQTGQFGAAAARDAGQAWLAGADAMAQGATGVADAVGGGLTYWGRYGL